MTHRPSGGQSFPKSDRIRCRKDYLCVQRGGKRLRVRHLVAMVKRSGSDKGRIGFTVSRKVGNAVFRNRVKRWLRESVRRRQLPVFDVVFIAKSSAPFAGFEAIDRDVAAVFGQLMEA